MGLWKSDLIYNYNKVSLLMMCPDFRSKMYVYYKWDLGFQLGHSSTVNFSRLSEPHRAIHREKVFQQICYGTPEQFLAYYGTG